MLEKSDVCERAPEHLEELVIDSKTTTNLDLQLASRVDIPDLHFNQTEDNSGS